MRDRVESSVLVNRRVSLVVPTYDRGEILRQTIEMALNQDYPNLEVIVVDQTRQPLPSVLSFVEDLGDRIKYLRLAVPNLPAARNAAVRASTGEIVIFIDDDVIIGSDYVSAHLQAYSDNA